MRCPSCGCEYQDTKLKCPFCGTENTALAKERQQQTLDALQEESQDIQKNLHKELRQKTDRKVAKTGVLVLAGILLLLVVTLIGSLIFKWVSGSREKRNLEQLEAFLLEQDFEALSAMIDRIDNSYQSPYDKYRTVAFAYDDLIYAQESLESYYDFAETGHLTEEQLVDSLSWAISPCINALLETHQELNDQLIRGNEAAMERIQAQAYEMLTEDLLLTEEEIEEAFPEEDSYITSEAVLPLAQISYERITSASGTAR